jgi:hypothetical protein
MNTQVASIKDVKRGNVDIQMDTSIEEIEGLDLIFTKSEMANRSINEIFKAWYFIRNSKGNNYSYDYYMNISDELQLSHRTKEYLDKYFTNSHTAYQVMDAVSFFKTREFTRKGYEGMVLKLALRAWNEHHMHDFVKEVGLDYLKECLKTLGRSNMSSLDYPLRAIWNKIPLNLVEFLSCMETNSDRASFNKTITLSSKEIRKITLLQSAFINCQSSRLVRDLGSYMYGTYMCKGLSVADFKFLIKGIKFWTNARMGLQIKYVAPSVFVTLGKLNCNELRYAALHEAIKSIPRQLIDSRFKYTVTKRSINWECVKEVRLVLNHESQPKARKFFKEHDVYVQSRYIPDVINLKALNMLKKLELHKLKDGPSYGVDEASQLFDCIKVANIFGVHSVDVLTRNEPSDKRGKYVDPHFYVNVSDIKPVNCVLSQQWNQFFFNNEDLAKYAGFVRPDMEVFKSKEQFLQYVRTQRYTNVPQGFEHLVDLCARHELTNNQFSQFVSKVETLNNKTSEMLPFVRIDGSAVEGVGHQYTLEKLDANDPAVLLIGLDTSCCQHIDGAGRSCAIHSYEKADSAVYVVRKQGQIIAQSWVWRNKDNGVVFDSIEVNISERNNLEPIAYMFKELANQLIGKLMIDSVYVGNTNYGMTGLVLNTIGKLTGSPCRTRMISHCSYMDGDSHYLVSASESFIKKHLTFDDNTSILAVCA